MLVKLQQHRHDVSAGVTRLQVYWKNTVLDFFPGNFWKI